MADTLESIFLNTSLGPTELDDGEHTLVTTNSASTNLTTSNYIGIASGSYTNGQTATVQTMGAIDDAQSGLTIASKHYVQPDGTLSTSVGNPSVEAGLAVSATKLLVKG